MNQFLDLLGGWRTRSRVRRRPAAGRWPQAQRVTHGEHDVADLQLGGVGSAARSIGRDRGRRRAEGLTGAGNGHVAGSARFVCDRQLLSRRRSRVQVKRVGAGLVIVGAAAAAVYFRFLRQWHLQDRKSTRLNSSH